MKINFNKSCYLKTSDWHPHKFKLTLKQIENILDRAGYTYKEKNNGK